METSLTRKHGYREQLWDKFPNLATRKVSSGPIYGLNLSPAALFTDLKRGLGKRGQGPAYGLGLFTDFGITENRGRFTDLGERGQGPIYGLDDRNPCIPQIGPGYGLIWPRLRTYLSP